MPEGRYEQRALSAEVAATTRATAVTTDNGAPEYRSLWKIVADVKNEIGIDTIPMAPALSEAMAQLGLPDEGGAKEKAHRAASALGIPIDSHAANTIDSAAKIIQQEEKAASEVGERQETGPTTKYPSMRLCRVRSCRHHDCGCLVALATLSCARAE